MTVTQCSTNAYGVKVSKTVHTAIYMGGVHTLEKTGATHTGFQGFGVAITGNYPKAKAQPHGVMVENVGQTVLLLVNPHSDKRQIQYCVDGTWYYFELLPDTVATVVIEG